MHMTTFQENFRQHLASGETLEETARWYFSEENAEARWQQSQNYDDMSEPEQAFFDYLNDVVFTQALAEH
jgi:hypothetical protein